MGLFDAITGRRKVKPPAPDRLFAITTAQITLSSEHGINPAGSAAIVFHGSTSQTGFERNPNPRRSAPGRAPRIWPGRYRQMLETRSTVRREPTSRTRSMPASS